MENQTTTENRKHKDSLFVDYFSKDRDWKQHFLSLYNALHGTNLQVETTRLERVNLEQVLYMDYYNDIAVMVNDQFILMIEHQSTINPNMPLRLLEYISRIYGNMMDSKAKFSDKLIPLAKPEFFVFYTGNQDLPSESYLHLSDAFKLNHVPNLELTLELKVKVCKIKSETPSVIAHCVKVICVNPNTPATGGINVTQTKIINPTKKDKFNNLFLNGFEANTL